ncbi:MAG: hypothetical protein LBF09_05180, partial [Odoribacteraceae bacterium]|nr:hypothetical protein [Odoribacteraceae bacterium]
QESRGYDEIGLDSRHWLLAESGDYMYHYKENGKWHVNINGKIHDKAYDASLDDNDGSFSYLFARDDGQLYENTNGTVRETGRLERMTRGVFDSDKYYGSNLDILSDDRKHSLYSSLEYPYVAVDGKRYGAAPALFAWYDREHDTFSWNAIEGRELVCYTLRLK